MDTAKWLEENGMDCRRYGARISRAACATYQETGDMAACGTCADAVRGVKPLPMKKKPVGRGLHLYIDQGIRLESPEPAPQPATFEKKQVAEKPARPARPRRRPAPRIRRTSPPAHDLEAGIARLARLGNSSARALLAMMDG